MIEPLAGDPPRVDAEVVVEKDGLAGTDEVGQHFRARLVVSLVLEILTKLSGRPVKRPTILDQSRTEIDQSVQPGLALTDHPSSGSIEILGRGFDIEAESLQDPTANPKRRRG